MNIESSKVAIVEADAAGSSSAMSSFSRKTLASRAKKSGSATEQQLHDADAPMSEILREEDQKHRQ